jgi:hypothetical protein
VFRTSDKEEDVEWYLYAKISFDVTQKIGTRDYTKKMTVFISTRAYKSGTAPA